MHIKKLEISGFKSFVERTSIHFDHDIIGIVGPNGCGKSNVVDAIRWCMGEQSAKHLRGRSMEDVIFNGSDTRSPAGLAEVTITFDNTDPTYAESLPVEYRDYPEIAVTRRLFRDGTSEYRINAVQVRLRDITELFLGTGVGTKAYSIVEQGRIGQIVSARPEDRRLFIEEAAGVTKYKQRRKQAERKMELTRQNLARVHDIVSEIERTSASLQRQVAKAERYKAYRNEHEDLVLHDASHRLLGFIVVEKVHRSVVDDGKSKIDDLSAGLAEAETGLTQARAVASEIEARTDDASKRAFAADNDVSALQSENQRARDRIVHLEEKLSSATQGQVEATAKITELRKEAEELGARLESLSQDEGARQSDAASEDEALEELREQESDARAQAASAEARLDGLATRRLDGQQRMDALLNERDVVVGEQESHAARKTALAAALAEAESGKRLTEEERGQLEGEISSLRGTQLESERVVDTLKNDLGMKRNRLRVLEDLHRRLEGVGAGARALISQGDAAVLGLVADRIEAPEELTAAFAGLLGERLTYVVVENPERGLELLTELRGSGRGRGHIVPLRPAHVAEATSLDLSAPGVIGRLSERLVFNESDAGLVHALVGGAVLTESAEAAVAFVRQHPGSTAVSIDGTVARPEGVISGGSGDDVAAAMVEQKREMHHLGDEIGRLSAIYEEKSEAHNRSRARLMELETSLDAARQAAHEGALAHVTVQKDLAETEKDLERAARRQEAIQAEVVGLTLALEAASLSEAECSQELETVRGGSEHSQALAAEGELRLANWRERVSVQATLVMERKVRLAQVKEQTGAVRMTLERVVGEREALTKRRERLAEEVQEAAVGLGQTAARIVHCREARIKAAEVSVQAHSELEVARSQLEETRATLGSCEGRLREYRVQQAEIDSVVRDHEMALQRSEMEREHLLGSVAEKFRGLNLHRVVGDYHLRPPPTVEEAQRMAEVSKLIDRLGPVNLDAAREYDDAQRRFHELNDQKIDIEKALLELDKAIKHMDRESRTRFRDTFEKVNELFKKSFSKNFRGGRAELRLTDPDDLLATGVDIIAQPPGKKLANIELMSGGEKALTAVSLIFAIFQHRPSPFCVLDEVDAPLDEANVARYNDAIRSMTANSQFILITHIRKTMQSVDVLYGVTMGEPGVSRLVSVKVNDEAKSRSEVLGETRSGSRAAAATEGYQVA
jgi:chromosome segregation protein